MKPHSMTSISYRSQVAICVLLLSFATANGQQRPVVRDRIQREAQAFELEEVRLRASPFKRAMMRDAGAVVAVVHRSLEPILDEVRRELPTLREVVTVGGAQGAEHDFDALIAAARPHPAEARAQRLRLLLAEDSPCGVVRAHGVVSTHRGARDDPAVLRDRDVGVAGQDLAVEL